MDVYEIWVVNDVGPIRLSDLFFIIRVFDVLYYNKLWGIGLDAAGH